MTLGDIYNVTFDTVMRGLLAETSSGGSCGAGTRPTPHLNCTHPHGNECLRPAKKEESTLELL